MKIIKKRKFGKVYAYELGYSPVGRPLMTVNCFVVGDILIDTGQSHMRKAVTDIVAKHKISAVLLTHHHEDHSGNAAVLKNLFHLPVLAHPLTIDKMKHPYKILPYQHWMFGATMPAPLDRFPRDYHQHHGLCFKQIHTPGHCKDHTVFFETNHGWLFSGDLYLGDRIKYFRADEKIDEQIASLKKVLSYDFDALFCCHRTQFRNGKKHLARKLQYLEDFYGRVSVLANQGFGEKRIMHQLQLEEQRLVKLICFGNVSMCNMVRSVIAAHKPQSL